MSFSMGLMARLRSYARDAFVLAKVDLKSLDGLSTQTFYASTAPVITPDGQAWEPLILSAGPVSARGGLGTTDIALATANLVLANRKVGFQTSGTITSLLSAHRFIGSTVTLYLWERGHTTFPDGQVFKGTVIGCESSVNGVELSLRQRTDWNRPVAPRYVNKKDYPRASDSSVGLPIPLVYGRISGLGLRRPWLSPFGIDYHALDYLRGVRRVTKAVVVDAGRGGGAAQNPDARVLVAGHAAKSIISTSLGTMMYLEQDGHLALLDSSGAVINNATEAGIKLVDDFDFAWVGLAPTEVLLNTNSALDPRNALEPDDTKFSYLDYNAGYRDLRVKLPSLSFLGGPVNVGWVIGYEGASLTENIVRVGIWDDTLVASSGEGSLIGQLAGPGTQLGTLLPWVGTPGTMPWPSGTWDWSNNRILRVRFNSTTAGWVRIHFLGLRVQFKPREALLQTERFIGRYRTVPRHEHGLPGGRWSIAPHDVPVMEPAVTELQGKFYGNVHGYADDGSGTYTGTGNALIERMPDIARHLLITSGGQSASDIETGSGAFGSFTDARAVLKDFTGSDLIYAISIADSTDVMSAISWITRSAFSMITLSPLDDKFKLNVWREDAPADYAYTFAPGDIVGPVGLRAELTPLSDVVTGVKVAYGHSGHSGSYGQEATLTHDRSVGGYEFRNLRDEYLTVVDGVNDRINWFRITARTATLTPGDYTPASFASHLRTIMKAVDNIPYHINYGGVITAGYQDKIDYTISAVTYAATVNPATYTMEGLAAEVARALNAQGPGGFSCTYSRATRKFTISNATSFTLKQFTGANSFDEALAQLGYAVSTDVTGTSLIGDYEREEGFFSLLSITSFTLLFQSGVDGSDSATAPRTCAELLGFSSDADPPIAGDYRGHCPKGNREQAMKKAADRYAPRRELSIEGRAIYETRTALDLRNRVAGLLNRPRVVVAFATERAMDMERGRIITFSPDFDAILPYPGPDSDGLWAGKGFVVVECEQDLGPAAFLTRIVAVSVNEAVVAAPPEGELWGFDWGNNWG